MFTDDYSDSEAAVLPLNYRDANETTIAARVLAHALEWDHGLVAVLALTVFQCTASLVGAFAAASINGSSPMNTRKLSYAAWNASARSASEW